MSIGGGVKVNNKIIGNVSAALTFAASGGLLAVAWFVFPALDHAKSKPIRADGPETAWKPPATQTSQKSATEVKLQIALAAAEARIAATPPPEARQDVVQQDVVRQDSAEIELAAARKPKSSDPEIDAKAPDTVWDGRPLTRGTVPAAPPPTAPTAHPSTNKASPPTVAPAVPAPAGKSPSNTTEPPASATAPADQPPAAPPPPPVEEWSATEIADALKECLKLLGPVDAEIEPVDAMRKGPCGAPAPIKLKSVGRENRIEFAPAIEVNCKLAVGIAEWSDKVLQPAAKSVLGSRVTRISGASGYACRNRYGLANAPLSEHALANAVDVPAFVLADGRTVRVKAGWGLTARDILKAKSEALAAAKSGAAPTAEGAKATVEQSTPAADAKSAEAGRDTKSKDGSGKVQTDGNLTSKEARSKDAKPKTGKARDTGPEVDREASELGSAADDRRKGQRGARDPAAKLEKVAALKGPGAQRLGAAPASDAKPAPAPQALDPVKVTSEGKFLRQIAKGACETFGTMLGPEANEAHRDHFHFDMKARRYKAYCQ